jgi:flagellar motor switch protein FliG
MIYRTAFYDIEREKQISQFLMNQIPMKKKLILSKLSKNQAQLCM